MIKELNSVCQFEGWLKVLALDTKDWDDIFAKDWPGDGSFRNTFWHSSFVVVSQKERSLVCYKSEEASKSASCSLNRVRLDGGYRVFFRRWGYMSPPVPQIDVRLDRALLDCDTNGLNCFGSHHGLDRSEMEKFATESLDRRTRLRSTTAPFNNYNCLASPGIAVAESASPSSTPHKIATFLTRPFRSTNLKRAKSVSKIGVNVSSDAVTEPSNIKCLTAAQASDSQTDHFGAPFSSASSVEQKHGNNSNTNTNTFAAESSCYNSRFSRSQDSLLSYALASHEIDLRPGDVVVKPLHSSLLNVPHCFSITTSRGAVKLYQCRTAGERDQWLESLRRTMQPNLDNVRRTENNLQIWILEAKGILAKKRYYCELCFDKTLYGRTSAKQKADICFWGEQFEFNHLPKLEVICVNLYREADKKKQKDRSTLIGFVNIPVTVLVGRQPVERWYAVNGCDAKSGKGDLPAVRIKARYQTVNILPLPCYKELLHYVQVQYQPLCVAMEHALSVKAKEDLSVHLVHVLQKLKLAKEFLCDVIMWEVESLDNEHLMFRGNSIATKAMEAYMKLVGDQYLQETFSDFIRSVLASQDDCEVDPVKIAGPISQLEKNRKTLMFFVELAWTKIVNSFHYFPIELRQVFAVLRQRMKDCQRPELTDNLISSCIFLRFICPSILSPSLFNLACEFPNPQNARNLTFIAKAIQSLANFTKFGGKEEFMEFMNSFVVREWHSMKDFLAKISSPVKKDPFPLGFEFDGYIDLGKELSLLHQNLVESIPIALANKKAVDVLQSFPQLQRIVDSISDALSSPNVSCFDNRNSWLCDSLSPATPSSDYDNAAAASLSSGSKFARRLPNEQHQRANAAATPFGRSNSGDHLLTSSASSAHVGGRFGLGRSALRAAATLDTSDEYVLFSALDENLTLRKTGLAVQRSRAAHRNLGSPVPSPPTVRALCSKLSAETLASDKSSVASDDNDDAFRNDRPVAPADKVNLSRTGFQSRQYATSCSPYGAAAHNCVKRGLSASVSHDYDATARVIPKSASCVGNGPSCDESTDSVFNRAAQKHSATQGAVSPTNGVHSCCSQNSIGAGSSSGYNSLSLSNSSSPAETSTGTAAPNASAASGGKSKSEDYGSTGMNCAQGSRSALLKLSRSVYADDAFIVSDRQRDDGNQSSPKAAALLASTGSVDSHSLSAQGVPQTGSVDVADNLTAIGAGHKPSTPRPIFPLSFANPLYHLQDTPLLRKSVSHSLPNIQNSPASRVCKSTCSCCSDPSAIIDAIDEDDCDCDSALSSPLSTVTSPAVIQACQIKIEPLAVTPLENESLCSDECQVNRSGSSVSSGGRAANRAPALHSPLSQRSLVVLGSSPAASCARPRTNPRFLPSHSSIASPSNASSFGCPPRSPRMGVGCCPTKPPMRRTQTDSLLSWFSNSCHENANDETDSCNNGVASHTPGSSSKELLLAQELAEMRMELELTQSQLKEAEQRERSWRQKYEALKKPPSIDATMPRDDGSPRISADQLRSQFKLRHCHFPNATAVAKLENGQRRTKASSADSTSDANNNRDVMTAYAADAEDSADDINNNDDGDSYASSFAANARTPPQQRHSSAALSSTSSSLPVALVSPLNIASSKTNGEYVDAHCSSKASGPSKVTTSTPIAAINFSALNFSKLKASNI